MIHELIITLLALAIFLVCAAIIQQGDALCALLGINPWLSGLAVAGVWGWSCLWFVHRESRRMDHVKS
jgi:hypothetical protein